MPMADPSRGLAARLAGGEVLHLPACVTHARRGKTAHSLRHGADFVLLAPEVATRRPLLMGRNRAGLFSLHDRDHGGVRGAGTGAAWARRVLADAGLPQDGVTLALLAQPRFIGFWFNPVAFWLAFAPSGDLVAVVAEVNNTFGQRHSYVCHLPDFAPITAQDRLGADKVFHVSPFQDVAGRYEFRFALSSGRIAISITQIDGDEGVHAAMAGAPRRLTNAGLALSALRRPGGALRVVALIYWHALRLRLKGVAYRPLPAPPERDVT